MVVSKKICFRNSCTHRPFFQLSKAGIFQVGTGPSSFVPEMAHGTIDRIAQMSTIKRIVSGSWQFIRSRFFLRRINPIGICRLSQIVTQGRPSSFSHVSEIHPLHFLRWNVWFSSRRCSFGASNKRFLGQKGR
jgi:hypothetical protein